MLPFHGLKPILSSILEAEFDDFVSSYDSPEVQTQVINKANNTLFFKTRGAVVTAIEKNCDSFRTLSTSAGFLNTENRSLHNYAPLFDNVIENILTFSQPMTFHDAIKMAEPYITKAGPHFYGMLLRDNNVFINPYHPIAATAYLNNPTETKYQVSLYFYGDRSRMDRTYRTSPAYLKLAEESVTTLLKLAARQTDNVVTETSTCVTDIAREHQTFSVINREKSPRTNQIVNSASHTYLATHQCITRGTVAPYYGSSAIVHSTSGSRGFTLSPLRSGNLGSQDFRANSVEAVSVCTGSHPNSKVTSFDVLNHVNINSSYTKDIIADGGLNYIDYCIVISRRLYAAAGLIPAPAEPEVLPQPPRFLKEHIVKFFECSPVQFIQWYARQDTDMNLSDISTYLSELRDHVEANGITLESLTQSTPDTSVPSTTTPIATTAEVPAQAEATVINNAQLHPQGAPLDPANPPLTPLGTVTAIAEAITRTTIDINTTVSND